MSIDHNKSNDTWNIKDITCTLNTKHHGILIKCNIQVQSMDGYNVNNINTLWVNDHLGTQLRCIKRLLLYSSTCFEQHCAHHQEGELY